MFLGVLWCGATMNTVLYITRGAVNPRTWTHCGFASFLFHFSLTYSSALLIVMVVEKCFVLYFPFKAKVICTVRTAKIVCLVLAVLYAIFNGQFFFITNLHTFSNGQKECLYSGAPGSYVQILMNVIAILYSFAPFVIMILGNGAILCKFMVVKWKSRNASFESTNQALNKTEVSSVFMLVTISFAFFILTGPKAIAVHINKKIPLMVHVILFALYYLNHGINSVLYCISGSRFRKKLIQTLSCGKNNSNSSMNSTSMTIICSSSFTAHEADSSKY